MVSRLRCGQVLRGAAGARRCRARAFGLRRWLTFDAFSTETRTISIRGGSATLAIWSTRLSDGTDCLRPVYSKQNTLVWRYAYAAALRAACPRSDPEPSRNGSGSRVHVVSRLGCPANARRSAVDRRPPCHPGGARG